ncbi:MAG: phosphonopyruvate decarboxylase [Rhodospirillales bacterium]|nr:phosphonopyruvate decarboxylase [Rhodospirillales bacterium]
MIAADEFIEPARARGYDFYTGVPCSFLTPFINRAIGHPGLTYIAAASEGEAVGIAAGAWLAGRKTVVMCQNSGLGNAVNPLTSLNFPFRIPTLLIVTWRGQPGLKDEPQHELMGQITAGMLDTMRLGHCAFPKEINAVPGALQALDEAAAKTSLPFAMIMEKDSVRDDGLADPDTPTFKLGAYQDLRQYGLRPTRFAVLERLLAEAPADAAIIATTGKCGRELFTLADRPQHLYLVGSMGCAGAVGLGAARLVDRKVIVLDGDGAALMKLGSLATIGAYAPENLIHIVLDNGVHDSTGGQATVSGTVDFAGVARACGYAASATADSVPGFAGWFADALEAPGPHLLHLRIQPGSLATLGRPTIAPHEVARRFQKFLTTPTNR